MPTHCKIRIDDAAELRNKLDSLYEAADQITLAKWSIQLAKHVMSLAKFDGAGEETVRNGFCVNEAWQNGQARTHDVRQAGFQIHALAKAKGNIVHQAVLRVAGQAVGTGHMREHAMVAADYAIRAVNLLWPDNSDAVIEERNWQINSLSARLKRGNGPCP